MILLAVFLTGASVGGWLGFRSGERQGYRAGVVSRFPGAVARRQAERHGS